MIASAPISILRIAKDRMMSHLVRCAIIIVLLLELEIRYPSVQNPAPVVGYDFCVIALSKPVTASPSAAPSIL